MSDYLADVAHLFRRSGFGALSDELAQYESWAWSDLVDLVLDTSRAPTTPTVPAEALDAGTENHLRAAAFLHYWLDMASRPVDQAPVVEKVTLFLSGLLPTSLVRTHDVGGAIALNQLFRSRGMDDYRDVLREAVINTAMLRYLDNVYNRVGVINENFARELLELFTLGPGVYDQQDVTEAARAWTGHGLDAAQAGYLFDAGRHDYGSKTFLGVTGALDGPDVIDIIFDQRRDDHARFMCHKLWEFFAYPVEPHQAEVSDIMAAYSAGLRIGDAIRAIFLHPRFRSAAARWALVRSPIEYLVAVMRHTDTDCSVLHPEWWCGGMGQHPFYPPNVNGWGHNEYWLTSSAGLVRLTMVNYLHAEIAQRGDLADVYPGGASSGRTSSEVVDSALANYRIAPVSATSRQSLVDYVERVRASAYGWSERTGLLHLPLLLPELVLA